RTEEPVSDAQRLRHHRRGALLTIAVRDREGSHTVVERAPYRHQWRTHVLARNSELAHRNRAPLSAAPPGPPERSTVRGTPLRHQRGSGENSLTGNSRPPSRLTHAGGADRKQGV